METIDIKKLFPKKTEEVIEKLAFFTNCFSEEFKSTSKRKKKKIMRDIFVLAKINHCRVIWLGDDKVCCLPDQWLIIKRNKEFKITDGGLRYGPTHWAFVYGSYFGPKLGGKRK